MLRYFLKQYTVHPIKGDGFLKNVNISFNISKYFQCSLPNKTVEDWINTLTEVKRKKIKLIQHEVSNV